MVDRSDINEEDDNKAAMLYRRYRLKQSAVSTGVQAGLTKQLDAHETEDSLASDVYNQYRQNRLSTNDASVEAALDSINRLADAQFIANNALQADQPNLANGAPEIQSIDVQPGSVHNELNNPKQAANNANWFKRLALGGVAAVMLGLVLIPQLFNEEANRGALQATLPTALSNQASAVVAYIDGAENTNLGFSNSADAKITAFKNGVLSVDLALVVQSGKREAVFPLLRQISALASDETDNSDEPNAIVAAAVNINKSIRDFASVDILGAQLDELLGELKSASENTKQLDWYQVGRSVESVRVAAEYALETSDLHPLEQALLLGSQLDRPVEQAPATDSVEKLFNFRMSAPNEFVQANEILAIANDVKLLMH